MSVCHKVLCDPRATSLTEAEARRLQKYIVQTVVADDTHGVCGTQGKFDAIQVAWVVAAASAAAAASEAKEDAVYTLSPDAIRPHMFATLVVPPDCERSVALRAIREGVDVEVVRHAARFFVWRHYLRGFIEFEQGVAQPLPPDDPGVSMLRRRLQEELAKSSHGDTFTALGRELLRGGFLSVAGANEFRRQFPARRDGMSMVDVLETDVKDAAQLNQQSLLRPHADWDKMLPGVQDNWLLAMFMYRLGQDIPSTEVALDFRSHYLVHWMDIGSPEAEARFRRRRFMDRESRPLVVNLGEKAWCVLLRKGRRCETVCRTHDVVYALATWMFLCRTQYDNQLENGASVPLLDVLFLARAATNM
jgi:hypothetical protein